MYPRLQRRYLAQRLHLDALGSDRSDFEVKALKRYSQICLMVSLAVVGAFPAVGLGHAFPLRSDPSVGWTVTIAPPKVTIWFDGELEPAFSTITVYNSTKQKVDKGNSRVSGPDASVPQVALH